MKKITSFTHLYTGEGHRIAYTYSEIDEQGNLISQNSRGNFIEVHPEVIEAIETILDDIKKNHLQ